MTHILIIEDDIMLCQILEAFLAQHDFRVAVANTVQAGMSLLLKNSYDLALIDYRLPDGVGLDLLTLIRDNQLSVAPIVMTSFHDVRTVVTTIRTGAYDYITKPVNPDELLLVLDEVLRKKNSAVDVSPMPSGFIEGDSVVAQRLNQHIKLVAPTEFTVIIQGDSGTGKELAARNIHELSNRRNAPFVALDCGALSSDLAGSELFGHIKGAFTGAVQNKTGQFELANGGTLFLDEVGNLSYEIQVKLLRALQERIIQPVGSSQQIKIDVRIISATNDNLLNSVRNGKFREDLYHRLNEFTIQVPSLQERKEDIGIFINFFIKQTNTELGKQVTHVSPEVHDLFLKYDWPGNLRELKNIVKRAVLLATSNEITTDCLPREMLLSVRSAADGSHADLKTTLAVNERERIIKTLEQVKYNKSKAAKLLNIDRSTLYYKMSKYNID